MAPRCNDEIVDLTQADVKESPSGGFEADSSSPNLNDRTLYRRAVEAVIWGMPLVNYQLMYEAARRAGGPGDNQILYWPGLLDSTNQTLTPNPDLIYAMPFFNTMDAGPIVLEIPAAGERGALNGSIMNRWQVAIEDIGPAESTRARAADF
jgi:hypothetical protein